MLEYYDIGFLELLLFVKQVKKKPQGDKIT